MGRDSFNVKEITSDNEEVSQETRPGHILVIRLSAMGDVAMVVPVLNILVKNYPEVKITLLTRSFFKPMFKDLPGVRVYEADINGVHGGVTGLGRLAKELRDEGIAAVADLHNVLRSNVLKSVFFFFGIPVKQIDKGRSEKYALTRPKNKVFKPLKSTHERYADVFAALGYPLDLSPPVFLQKRPVSEKTRQLINLRAKKWLGIAPFAQHTSKTYPPELMEEVLKNLQQDFPDLQVFLFGGGNHEVEQLEKWENSFENALSVAGKITFEEELALISNLHAMLSMDSGNGHLAAMFGVPVITLWGVTHPYAGFRPFGQPEENSLLPDLKRYPQIPTSVYGKRFPYSYENAIRSISPVKVVEKVARLLL